MIRTLVCQREGCSGNQFYIESTENKIKAICRECKNVSEFDMDNYGLKVISSCSACKNDLFKLFHETETGKIYAKCSKCGAPPMKVYIDFDGIQISYEEKLLNEVKNIMCEIEQKICNLEIKMEMIERGQEVLEESLAYINQYMLQQR